MSLFLPRRPPVNLPFLIPSFAGIFSHICRRHESSARRTTKRLRTKPDPSFTASIPPSQINDHIVFNPPSSTPSPYHTPPVFLPSNDPRRQLLAQSHQHANPYNEPNRRLPPVIKGHRPYEKKYHLREKEIFEIRRLRIEDPYTWTRKKLAEKFGCSEFFVGMVSPATIAPSIAKRKDREIRAVEQVKERWGQRRRYAREDRAKRREMWGRDDTISGCGMAYKRLPDEFNKQIWETKPMDDAFVGDMGVKIAFG